ncbi:hypothetical protein QEH52_01860 [Coraliomargarita sp. SDUM461003]|uniref:Tyr recombinase domain-containing protein n=1 Tax=Thalassobacterium maritimum TaxID=3041265 RepID=A0ABU1AQC3_9BACT|nr:hypothetical protein [Coraliomargarita sp. SDUM461003]MDQ8206238.1 hypothetical protein [Coraliomargarita sp. SDUM461003]
MRKIDAETFAAQLGWEAMDSDLAVSAAERILIGRARVAAMAAGISTEALVDLGIEAARARRLDCPTLPAALEAYVGYMESHGAREASVDNIERFGSFLVARMGVEVLTWQISPLDLKEAALSRYSNRESIRSYMAVVIAFFRWCAAPERKWAPPEWHQKIQTRIGNVDSPSPAIATPQQVADFMAAAPAGLRAAFALQWFAGIRPEEVLPKTQVKAGLTWEAIDMAAKTISISAAVSKTRRPRLIHKCFDCLWDWLRLTPQRQRKGPIVTINARNYRVARRKTADAAGIDRPYPRDIMRHSFATYSYHRYGLEVTIHNTGHMSEPHTFFAHYKGDAIKSSAKKYAAIRPAK